MNVTFDRKAVLRLFRLLKKDGARFSVQWLHVTAMAEHVIFESGAVLVSLPALVLEPGAFTTRRQTFESVLQSFKNSDTLTIQADAGRFRIGSFSGQLLDYVSAPAIPEGFTPPPPAAET